MAAKVPGRPPSRVTVGHGRAGDPGGPTLIGGGVDGFPRARFGTRQLVDGRYAPGGRERNSVITAAPTLFCEISSKKMEKHRD